MRNLNGQTQKNKKPYLFKVYDHTKIGTDLSDQKIARFGCAFKTNNWAKVFIAFILDTTRVNAVTLYSMAQNIDLSKIDPYKIGMDLGMALVRPYMMTRSVVGLDSRVLMKRDFVMGTRRPTQDQASSSELKPAAGARRRCTICLDNIKGEGGKAK